MSARRTPIEQMRQLADDGMEPWQIAAALGVREAAVLVALDTGGRPGGAQRAVEDAASLVPADTSTKALAREMAEHFTAIDEAVDAITPEDIDARLTHVIALGETWGVDAPEAPKSEPGDATTASDEWQIHKPDSIAPARPMTRALAEHVAGYADGMAVRACEVCAGPIDDTGDVDEPWCHRCRTAMAAADEAAAAHEMPRDVTPARIYPEPNLASAVTVEAHLIEMLPRAEHEHDPFPVADETGVWHAECECGTRWDRALCEYSGCTAYVAALHIARTGTRRHAHHPAGATP